MKEKNTGHIVVFCLLSFVMAVVAGFTFIHLINWWEYPLYLGLVIATIYILFKIYPYGIIYLFLLLTLYQMILTMVLSRYSADYIEEFLK